MTEQDTPKMTHDEMIDTLKGLVFGTFDRTTAKEREALDMAISALKPTCKIDESNFSMEQYKIDLQSAYDCGKAKALKGFEGMTNGEVIQALFPNGKVIECDEATGYEQMLDEENSYCSWFDGLWWNGPYQKEGEK